MAPGTPARIRGSSTSETRVSRRSRPGYLIAAEWRAFESVVYAARPAGSPSTSKTVAFIMPSRMRAVYAKRSQAYEKPRWEVTVQMDEGGRRVLSQRYEPFLREGDRVRVSGTQLELID